LDFVELRVIEFLKRRILSYYRFDILLTECFDNVL